MVKIAVLHKEFKGLDPDFFIGKVYHCFSKVNIIVFDESILRCTLIPVLISSTLVYTRVSFFLMCSHGI